MAQMNKSDQFYAEILVRLIDLDTRESQPPRRQRLDTAMQYLQKELGPKGA